MVFSVGFEVGGHLMEAFYMLYRFEIQQTCQMLKLLYFNEFSVH